MNKQMFVDESASDGRLIYSGVIFKPENVAPFSTEYRNIYPKGELGKKKRSKTSGRAKTLYRLGIKYAYGTFDLVIPETDYNEEFLKFKEKCSSWNYFLSGMSYWEEFNPEASTLCNPRYAGYIACCSFFEQIQLKFGLTEPVD